MRSMQYWKEKFRRYYKMRQKKFLKKLKLIKDGKIVKVGKMKDIKGDSSLEEVFLELEEK